jgi:hypothetical protein
LYCEEHRRPILEAMKSVDPEKGAFAKSVVGPVKAGGCLCKLLQFPDRAGRRRGVYISHRNRQCLDDRGEYDYMDMRCESKRNVYNLREKRPGRGSDGVASAAAGAGKPPVRAGENALAAAEAPSPVGEFCGVGGWRVIGGAASCGSI